MADGARLHALQQIDLALARVHAGLAALDTGEAARAAAEASDAALAEARAHERTQAAELRDRDLELQSTLARIAKAERDLYSGAIGNPKELVALHEEVAALRRHQAHLEERILEAMENADRARAAVAARSTAAGKAYTHLADVLAEIEERRVTLLGEEVDLVRQREAVVAELDGGLVRRYERRRADLGGVAVATIVAGACSGCSIAVSPRIADRVAAGEIATCEECGRMLVARPGG